MPLNSCQPTSLHCEHHIVPTTDQQDIADNSASLVVTTPILSPDRQTSHSSILSNLLSIPLGKRKCDSSGSQVPLKIAKNVVELSDINYKKMRDHKHTYREVLTKAGNYIKGITENPSFRRNVPTDDLTEHPITNKHIPFPYNLSEIKPIANELIEEILKIKESTGISCLNEIFYFISYTAEHISKDMPESAKDEIFNVEYIFSWLKKPDVIKHPKTFSQKNLYHRCPAFMISSSEALLTEKLPFIFFYRFMGYTENDISDKTGIPINDQTVSRILSALEQIDIKEYSLLQRAFQLGCNCNHDVFKNKSINLFSKSKKLFRTLLKTDIVSQVSECYLSRKEKSLLDYCDKFIVHADSLPEKNI